MGRQIAAWRIGALAPLLVAVLMGLTAGASSAGAQTFNATDAASFATAVASANSASGANTIVLAAGSYSPTSTVMFTNTSGTLTIDGPSPVPNISGFQAKFVGGAVKPPGAPLFNIAAGVTVDFNDIAISNAGSSGNPAIDDFGTINFTQSAIGGATGPGLQVEALATANVLNSTISDGLDIGVIDDGTATLTNTTITRNANGGIDNASGTLNLVNTIIAENDGNADCTAGATTTSDSLDSDGSCGVGALSAKNPKLGAIGSHGGDTPTDVPAVGSPAIGAGASACPALDQRGAPRPSTGCDIGAVQTDTTKPTIPAGNNVGTNATSSAGATVTFTPAWSDADAPITTSSCAPSSGSNFPVGSTLVSCSATDAFGNQGTGTFSVIVKQAPVVTISGLTNPYPATSNSGATVNFTATATDAVDGTDPVTCLPASGSVFPIGDTTVTCSTTDSLGTPGSQTATVTVTDTAGPVITVPTAGVSAPATGPDGAVVTYTATATDPVDGTDSVNCAPASDTTFAVGQTTVTCNATDKAGNAATPKSFVVTVTDLTPPVITTPTLANPYEATGVSGAAVSFTVTATDLVDGADAVICSPASGSTFAIGATPVTCNATDKAGNPAASKTFTITVVDNPQVSVPGPIDVAATGASGAVVTYVASATDPVDGTLHAVCAPASGTTFGVGATTVACSATNAHANTTTKTFTVTVSDQSPPVITVPANITVAATGAGGATATFTASATDLLDGSDPVACSPGSGSTFGVGTTTVTCSSTDKAGNTASKTFTVTVTDLTAPTISVPATITVAAASAAGAPVQYSVSANDLVSGAITPSCSPASGATFAVGATTVTCTATDRAGNSVSGSFTVTVGPFASQGVLGSSTTVTRGSATIHSAKVKGNVATIVVACTGSSTSTCTVQLELLGTHNKAFSSKKTLTLKGGRDGTVSLRLTAASVSSVRTHHNVELKLTQTGGSTHTKTLVFKG